MKLLILVFIGLACLAVVVLLGIGMMLDARSRRERMARSGPIPLARVNGEPPAGGGTAGETATMRVTPPPP